MSLRGGAYIVGAYEHPLREMPDRSVEQIHAEVALGALKDAGLTLKDVDAYFHVGGPGAMSMQEYLNLNLSYVDSTAVGGSSPVYHVGHAVNAIVNGHAKVALVSLAARARTGAGGGGLTPGAEAAFEQPYGPNTLAMYALAAQRHMYEFGTTSRQLAEIKVAAALHASYNPNAFIRKRVTIEDVINSPMMADPLHRQDCCVVTDGGGALVIVAPEIARDLKRKKAKVLGQGEAPKHMFNGKIDLTYTGARWSGPRAFAEAKVTPADIDYVSIYDSFTITVLMTLEDLGFCKKGEGGRFVENGTLQSPNGKLPFNTDGGGLASNHPGMGGMTKVIEAVRQIRGEATPETQVKNVQLALAHGTGGSLGTRHASATVILGQEDA